MIPLIVAGALLAISAIEAGWNIYQTNQTTKASDEVNKYVNSFYSGASAENSAYFERYIRAHHLQGREIKYPYRTGMIYNMTPAAKADLSSLYNNFNRSSSWVHGFTSMSRSASYGYAATRPQQPKTVYLYPHGGYYGY